LELKEKGGWGKGAGPKPLKEKPRHSAWWDKKKRRGGGGKINSYKGGGCHTIWTRLWKKENEQGPLLLRGEKEKKGGKRDRRRLFLAQPLTGEKETGP